VAVDDDVPNLWPVPWNVDPLGVEDCPAYFFTSFSKLQQLFFLQKK
jgi:hypothetical protein